MDKVRLTLESAREFVVHIAMLRVDLRESHKFKIVGCCVIETLRWELVLAVVSHADGNVVIAFDALNAAPEH